jgi:hypothetical protein
VEARKALQKEREALLEADRIRKSYEEDFADAPDIHLLDSSNLEAMIAKEGYSLYLWDQQKKYLRSQLAKSAKMESPAEMECPVEVAGQRRYLRAIYGTSPGYVELLKKQLGELERESSPVSRAFVLEELNRMSKEGNEHYKQYLQQIHVENLEQARQEELEVVESLLRANQIQRELGKIGNN